ncbi:hypothetical protein EVAR_13670_1 [Eumeta japonica]|uniref:Uncharacterized protein n=1 Tax=Eumeta variegata TaxID=151549 RepID=A0A4C1UBB0_EUMVA|nr:hypothetical protein EVAR_13670_1 [Eumeta japonica]
MRCDAQAHWNGEVKLPPFRADYKLQPEGRPHRKCYLLTGPYLKPWPSTTRAPPTVVADAMPTSGTDNTGHRRVRFDLTQVKNAYWSIRSVASSRKSSL